jgi:RNA polymerase sigma-70 factor (ECF subfamily)
VNARNVTIEDRETGVDRKSAFEGFFRLHYQRIARAVARLTGDPACAEDLAIEAFWRLWCTPQAQGEKAGGWVYRTALRLGLSELRSNARRHRYEREAGFGRNSRTPEEAHALAEERDQVRQVLAALDPRQSEVLLLRSSGLSYDEVAAALDVNPISVGSMISRAQQAFRKEYVKRYGKQ